jgi:ankyrin repeat protein
MWEQHRDGVKKADEKGLLPLHWAAKSDTNEKVVQCLCEQYRDALEVVDNNGLLPLHWAAKTTAM